MLKAFKQTVHRSFAVRKIRGDWQFGACLYRCLVVFDDWCIWLAPLARILIKESDDDRAVLMHTK